MSVKAFLLTVVLLSSVCPKVFAGKNSAPLEILYIANTNALLENCHCGSPSLGGLARISTLVREEREKNPNLLLVDGGDFFNTYPFEELNKTVLEIYDRLKPDVMALGENEFLNGISFIMPFIRKNRYKIISSNYKIDDLNTQKNIRKSNSVFLSYLDKNLFLNGGSQNIKFNENEFKSLYEKNKNRFLIVLYHGYYDNLKDFIARYPEIDLVLSAHSKAGELGKTGNTLIIGSGSDGEFINKITLDKKGEAIVKLLPVNLDIKQDEIALKYIKLFKEAEKRRRGER